MERFCFKPALLRSAVTYEVTDDTLIALDSAGEEEWRLALAEVDKAAFVSNFVRRYHMRRLDLIAGDTKRSIACTFAKGTPPDNPDRHAHTQLVAAILQRIEGHHTEFPVTLGEYGRSKILMFVIGVLTLLAGVVLVSLVIGTGVSTDRLIEVVVPIAAMILFGGYIANSFAPWRKPAIATAGKLARSLQPKSAKDDSNVNLPDNSNGA